MRNLFLFVCFLVAGSATGQGGKSFNDFAQFYPIGESPNIRYMSSYTKQETILFEANPVVRYSFYNNFMKGLMDDERRYTQAWYVAFRPQLRMYMDNSLPVKTPSYRVLLGTQHLFRVLGEEEPDKARFIGFSLESGHYSNGQDGSAFSELYPDESPESREIYRGITPSTNLSELLNRRSGNFSTNMSELILNYRSYTLDDDYLPSCMVSFNLGYVGFHDRFLMVADFGGYSEEDITIYGRHRFVGGIEYMQAFGKGKNQRYSLAQNAEYIASPHEWVNPVRLETLVTVYPFRQVKALGVFATFIYGHDNYNFRFVDSGKQVTVGVTWSQFPPFNLKTGI